MNHFYQSFLLLLSSILIVFFFNVAIADAGVIVRPPNNLGLVGYWSFDEGRGTQASDLSGNGNDGTLNGGLEWTVGRNHKALSFDGINSYVSIQGSWLYPSQTISFWAKPLGGGNWLGVSGRPISSLRWSNPDHDGFFFSFSGTTSNVGYTVYNNNQANQGGSFALNNDAEWHHFVLRWTPTNVSLFVDGNLVKSDDKVNEFVNNTSDMDIGRYNYQDNDYFNGVIDEVRIYNRALSASEIASLYSNTKSTVVGEAPANYYSDGLVAHYTFDGSTLSGTAVSDAVGASNGTLTSGPVPTLGKMGQGMLFNGSSGGISLGSPAPLQITGDQTIAMWLYPANFSTRRNPFAKAYGGEGTITQEPSGVLNYYYGTNGGNSSPYQGFGSNASLTLSTWNHVAIVRDLSSVPMRLRWYINGVETSSTNATYAAAVAGTLPALIGQGYVSRYAGVIDDVRIYNRALSASEVRGLAGGGFGELNSSTDNLLRDGLAGLWTFDSGTVSGSTVQDLSGNEKNGTIVGTQPSVVSGKIRDALAFNGTTGYIDFPAPLSSPDNWAYSFWFYPTGIPSVDWAGLVGQGNNPRVTFHQNLTVSTGAVYQSGGAWAGGTGSSPLSLNNWYQVTAVWRDASSGAPTHDLYINGSLVGSRTYPAAIVRPSGTHHVNRRDSNSSLDALVDDVRIYNRALTHQEVEQLYYMGN